VKNRRSGQRDIINYEGPGDAMGDQRGNKRIYEERIVRDRKICGGEPVFKGTRVTLRTVLAGLASGDTAEEILAEFPTLKLEDVRAAIAFAAASAEEDLPVPELPRIR
jgi:uncharacterized protein (DUF433 family)